MTYQQLEKLVLPYRPALFLEDLIPRTVRRGVITLLTPFVFLLLLPLAVHFLTGRFSVAGTPFSGAVGAVETFLPLFAGLFFTFLSVDMIFIMLESFYASAYYRAMDLIVAEQGIADKADVSFEAASFFYHAPADDLTGGFLHSPFGALLLRRVGVSADDMRQFLAARTQKLPAAALEYDSLDAEAGITLVDVALLMFRQDKEFAQFLFGKNIQEKDILGAARWVERQTTLARRRERWWSRDVLGRMPGLGKDLAYGETYRVERYAHELTGQATAATDFSGGFLRAEVEEVEAILTRDREANVIIVGEPGGGALEIVYRLVRLINTGMVLPALQNKRVMFLDANALIAGTKEKSTFESELLQLFAEATRAGNLILVISDLPNFIENARTIGSDAMSLIDPFIGSPHLQVIALSSPSSFHSVIEPNTAIMRRFEKVLVTAGDRDSTIMVLEDEVAREEYRAGVFFTYPAIEEVADGAVRYFPDAVMPDKAIDLVSDIIAVATEKRLGVITRSDVLDIIQTKTGIPVGEVHEVVERDRLLNLESFLHERVVGQNEAVKAIAAAMRRSRSGIANPNRPIGSFLFLGPTGVGKTETAKALAEVFFGSADKVLRLDMSEYTGANALEKLTGSFEQGRPGVLSSMLRESPYGVLLLDEFEKTTTEVMDLFLQVLDEGFFADMSGKRVNARNLIIIATSNAGADMIWEFMRQGGDLAAHKDEMIAAVVKAGIFRPELLNRFDGVILFHPVVDSELRQVAKLQLEKLRVRLRDRGVDLVINDPLIDELMKYGADPKFGARPMNRAIQDKVESIIAEKLIKGDLRTGQSVELSAEELERAI